MDIKELWNTKKWWIIGFGIVLLILLVILGTLLFFKIFRQYSYQELEQLMVSSSQKYVANHEKIEIGEDFTLSSDTLIEEKLMKDFSQLRKKDSCSGEVLVSWNEDMVQYIPHLVCSSYETKSLQEQILENEEIQEEANLKNGLYEQDDFYLYRGEFVDNYLLFANYLWRIMKMNEEQMILILADSVNNRNTYPYDDRFNDSVNSNRGRNRYENSRIAMTLNNIYEQDFKMYHPYMLYMDACVGARGEMEGDKSGSVECMETLKTPFTLLSVYDYMNASIDPGCTYSTNRNCSNYNYLTKASTRYWLLNGSSENSYDVYYSDAMGNINLDFANSKKDIRPVIAISSQVVYKSGNGTLTQPYEFYLY